MPTFTDSFERKSLKSKIKHIRKLQKEAQEEIAKGSPAQLADIADHVDLWGPFLCDELEKIINLLADMDKDFENFKFKWDDLMAEAVIQ